MKKPEFIKEISEKSGLTQKDVSAVIDALSEVVLDVVARNDKVKVGDIGVISGVDKPAHYARNPRTGEKIFIEARTGVPKMRFSKVAKE